MTAFSTAFSAIGLLLFVGGFVLIIRPSIYVNSRWTRQVFNPKLLQSRAYQLELRLVALVFALAGFAMLSDIAVGILKVPSARAFEEYSSLAVTITVIAICFVGLFSFVARKIPAVKNWYSSGSMEAKPNELRLKERKVSIVFCVVFLLIVGAAVSALVKIR
jgi:hypothetical protein